MRYVDRRRSFAPMSATITLTSGTPLHYQERGSGTPILCVHGTGSGTLAWAPAIPELARRGRVISYDRRGFSRSRSAEAGRPVSVAEHADDAAALLHALDATPAVVIGRSYGGSVAIDLALRYPAYVRALVLLEGVPESLDPEAERWVRGVAERTLAAGERGPAAAAETLFRQVLGDEGWSGLDHETRRMFLDNGPAIRAELSGGWLPDIPPRRPRADRQADAPGRRDRLASRVPARARPRRGRDAGRAHRHGRRRPPDRSGRPGGAGVPRGGHGARGRRIAVSPLAQASSGTSQSPESGGSVSLAEKGWPPQGIGSASMPPRLPTSPPP
jgi:pimeloyl-ACP methyl ester carboxylesterase